MPGAEPSDRHHADQPECPDEARSAAVGIALSTCPARTPLLLPVTAAAGSADPLMGAVLMGTFGIARGVPIVIAGALAGAATQFPRTRHT